MTAATFKLNSHFNQARRSSQHLLFRASYSDRRVGREDHKCAVVQMELDYCLGTVMTAARELAVTTATAAVAS